MALRRNLLLAIAVGALLLLVMGVALRTIQASYGQEKFSIPSDSDLTPPETIFVTVECIAKIEEYICDQTDEQYDLVKSAYQNAVEGCSDCDTLASAASRGRPGRIALIEVNKMREMGAVELCFSGDRLNDHRAWKDEWLHVATFSSGTVISEFGFSYKISRKWLMKKLETNELAIVVDSDGMGNIDPNGDALEIYFPCDDKSEKAFLTLLRTFGAVF